MSLGLLDRPRAGLASAVRGRFAGPEFETIHTRIWYTHGERWFREGDPIWRVHGDAAMLVGGIRALLFQSLHPVAMAAVSAHSGFRGDPWGRLHRTSRFLATTTYATVADAEQMIQRVRRIHRTVRGTTPDGVAYRADDPHLLGWVHVVEVDSFLCAYEYFGQGRLSEAERDGYVAQTGLVAARLGVVDPPRSVAELAEQLAAYRPELRHTEAAAEASEMLLRNPPLGRFERIGYGPLAAGAISTLPAWARAELTLPTLPVADRLVARPLARSALRTLRWALVPPEPGSAAGDP